MLISTGQARAITRGYLTVVPGTITKGRKRFRVVFSRAEPDFQSVFWFWGQDASGFRKGKAADVAREIGMEAPELPARRPEHAGDALRLSGPDLDQNMAARFKVVAARSGDHPVGIKPVHAAGQRQARVEIADIGIEPRQIG